MPTPTWQELTQQNIDTIQQMISGHGLSPDARAQLLLSATNMIANQHFPNASAHWNAFHNALRILIHGGLAPAKEGA